MWEVVILSLEIVIFVVLLCYIFSSWVDFNMVVYLVLVCFVIRWCVYRGGNCGFWVVVMRFGCGI